MSIETCWNAGISCGFYEVDRIVLDRFLFLFLFLGLVRTSTRFESLIATVRSYIRLVFPVRIVCSVHFQGTILGQFCRSPGLRVG